MAATDARSVLCGRLLGALEALLGGVFAPAAVHAVDLPADAAEVMFHQYDGGGVKANGPAFLVRKNIADKVSLNAMWYVDAVSNASIDVVTTASPFRERRNEYALGADYVYRDSKVSLSASSSDEPDYKAKSVRLDVSQETFGGMTTVNLGFSRGSDTVMKAYSPEFEDYAKHWAYRVGVTQILTPRWISSVNFEALSDDGFLGSPYRVARVFGAAVPERNPRTRSGRAVKFRVIGDLGSRDAIRADYRYYWDTWDIKGHTLELGYSRYFGDSFLADAYGRYHTQDKALFYSDNATTETTYISRNRQLSTFDDVGLGGRVTWSWKKVPGKYEIKLNGALEYVHFKFKDFTDLRDGSLYSFNATILQLYVTANF